MPENEPYDPVRHGTYGNYLRLKGLQVRTGGWSWQTRDQVVEDTARRKTVRDQCGHEVTERTDERGKYHRDVTINLPV